VCFDITLVRRSGIRELTRTHQIKMELKRIDPHSSHYLVYHDASRVTYVTITCVERYIHFDIPALKSTACFCIEKEEAMILYPEFSCANDDPVAVETAMRFIGRLLNTFIRQEESFLRPERIPEMMSRVSFTRGPNGVDTEYDAIHTLYFNAFGYNWPDKDGEMVEWRFTPSTAKRKSRISTALSRADMKFTDWSFYTHNRTNAFFLNRFLREVLMPCPSIQLVNDFFNHRFVSRVLSGRDRYNYFQVIVECSQINV